MDSFKKGDVTYVNIGNRVGWFFINKNNEKIGDFITFKGDIKTAYTLLEAQVSITKQKHE